MIRRRNLIWLVPLTLLVTFPLWRIPVAGFLTPRHSDEQPREGNGEKQNFNMTKVTILQTRNGQATATIRAARAATSATPDEYTLEEVDADLFNSKGEPTSITARQGIFNGASQQLTLLDEVVIIKESDGQKLFTDLLYYDDRQQLVYCPGETHIEGSDAAVDGTGLTHDMAAGTYELGGRVRCVISGSITP